MFSVKCKLCAFINISVMYKGLHAQFAIAYTFVILACALYSIHNVHPNKLLCTWENMHTNFQYFKPWIMMNYVFHF